MHWRHRSQGKVHGGSRSWKCRTSRFELHGATSYQLVNLLRLDRLARPRISPLRLRRLRIGQVAGGLLFRLGAVLALEAGKETSHVHAAAVVVARESGRRFVALSFVNHATGGTKVRLRSRTTPERNSRISTLVIDQIGLSSKRQCCHRTVAFGFGVKEDQARIGRRKTGRR